MKRKDHIIIVDDVSAAYLMKGGGLWAAVCAAETGVNNFPGFARIKA